MKQFALLIVALILFGCNTQKRQIRKLHELAYKYPHSLAEDCARLFPLKDSTSVRVDTVKADNTAQAREIDSLRTAINELSGKLGNDEDCKKYQEQVNDLKKKLGRISDTPCKPDTIRITKEIKTEDTRKFDVLSRSYNIAQDSLKIVKHDLTNTKQAKTSLIWWLVAATGIALIAIGFHVYKFFKP